MQTAALPDRTTPTPDTDERVRSCSEPYRSTPIFDQDSLPSALQREHHTREGTWAVIRVLTGQLRFFAGAGDVPSIATALTPVIVAPREPHRVEPLGPMTMRVDFYDHEPFLPPP